ncbi:MAG: ABC transporter ATP-binding protein [Candidatus Sulfomarinibacteraceae bacterium]
MDLRSNLPAVVVRDLHKWYRVYASPTERIKRVIGRKSRHLDIQALDGVDFEVPPGIALGIIGENGAGKSTLMKIIAGTTSPTVGDVQVRGTVAAILELGAAFHPEFSGRDNAVLYGALMGLDRAEMEARLDGIVGFAELGGFIDHPVKSYSTGMAMRLAFAVATHVDPDVLVVDEALAVGDGYFQKKCVDKIREIKDRGTTIVFCSHAMYYVTSFCERALWIANGRIERDGPAKEVVEAYEAHLQLRDIRRLEANGAAGAAGVPTQGKRVGRILSVQPRGMDGGPPLTLAAGDELVIDVEISSTDPAEVFHLAVTLDTLDGRCVLAASTKRDGEAPITGRDRYRIGFRVPSLPLAAGLFHIYAFLLDESGLYTHDQVIVTEAVRFEAPEWTSSLIDVERVWERR